MLPAANATGVAIKPAQPVPVQTAQKATQPQAPETARSSAGEAAAANVKAETPKAVQAVEQSTVTPRLRDQETFERTERQLPTSDAPAGPPPSFEESPLERQARVAFDPPEASVELPETLPAPAENDASAATEADHSSKDEAAAKPASIDPPPTPTERAEASFTETRQIAENREPATVDVKN